MKSKQLIRGASSGALCAALAGLSLAGAAQAAEENVVSELTVSATPLLGASLERLKIAAPVQTFSARALENGNVLDLSRHLNRAAASVYVNDIQNNPVQADLNYRGFTASPLLGTPQGISVYMDGVRLNQPFGDVVSWDLIPKAAIQQVTLVPGSNPLFGLNTLGGALSINTKTGLSAPGASVTVSGGDFGRRRGEIETGGSSGAFDWFVTANKFEEDGWRTDSPSDVEQAFAKLNWTSGGTTIGLTAAAARTDLNGNGLQEQNLLNRDYGSVFTKPDTTKNLSKLFNLSLSKEVSEGVRFTGNLYTRQIGTSTYNGDINEETLEENVYLSGSAANAGRIALVNAGYGTQLLPVNTTENVNNTPFPRFACIANVLLQDEPYEKCNGLINRTYNQQRDSGLSGQFSFSGDFNGMANQLVVGAAYLRNSSHFTQSAQFGYLTPDRGVVGVDAFADGFYIDDAGEPVDGRVNLKGETRQSSVFATDTLEVSPGVNLTLSARYDKTKVENRDQIQPTGPGTLSGDHDFSRLNPAVGITWQATPAVNLYVGYNEGSRAPSAIELGCADPANPCRLPNSMAGDPPLNQVVTKTVEAGLRGRNAGLNWSLGAFRAENTDDILFVSSSVTGEGYFKNFGKTKREGFEAAVNGRSGPFTFGASYTKLKATYETAEEVVGEANSENDEGPGLEGAIDITPGDRIPLIPEYVLKANVSWDVTSNFSISADMISVGSSYARGNENNEHQPDGVFYLGAGKSKAYNVVNIGADYRPLPAVRLFAQVDNLFDKEYATAAQLGNASFDPATGAFNPRPFGNVGGEFPQRLSTFYAPGAPRMITVGVKYSFN